MELWFWWRSVFLFAGCLLLGVGVLSSVHKFKEMQLSEARRCPGLDSSAALLAAGTALVCIGA